MTDDQAAMNRIKTDSAREKVEAYMRELQWQRYDPTDVGSYVAPTGHNKPGTDWRNLDTSEAFNVICLVLLVPPAVLMILQGAFPS